MSFAQHVSTLNWVLFRGRFLKMEFGRSSKFERSLTLAWWFNY
jgi:hypothetical protein